MTKIIVVQSFRGGTGKSTIASNLAVQLATLGKRVLVIDSDTRSPGIHALFGLTPESLGSTFTDYLLGHARIEDTIKDVSEQLKMPNGTLSVIPSSIILGDIATNLSSRRNFNKMRRAIEYVVDSTDVDIILVDTHPGVNEDMLLTAALGDVVLSVIRPDNQDYQGAHVTAELMRKLGSNVHLVLNKVHRRQPPTALRRKIERSLELPVIGVLPFTEEIMFAESQYVFSQKHKSHPFSKKIAEIATSLGDINEDNIKA